MCSNGLGQGSENAECGMMKQSSEDRIRNGECGLRPIGAYAYTPVGIRKHSALSKEHSGKADRVSPSRWPERFTRLRRASGLIGKETL